MRKLWTEHRVNAWVEDEGMNATYCSVAGVFLVGDGVEDGVGDAEVLDGVAADVHLRDGPEVVAVLGGADNVVEVDVHPLVDVGKVAVVRVAVLELDQDGVARGGLEQGEGQLRCGWRGLET